jgi:NAD(P)-dependent dehydrogenase (short-subunit alcohol dehydrogenase family)
MTIADTAVLVTGANRGHRAGPGPRSAQERRQAGGRRHAPAPDHPDGRVTPLTLDVTSAAQVQEAAEQVESLDV